MINNVIANVSNGIYTNADVSEREFYDDNWVFDENESVKWNREKVLEENEEVKVFNEKVKNKAFRGLKGFTEDLKEAIANELDLNLEQAGYIYNKAWEEGHNSGYSVVIYYVEDMVNLLKKINNAGTK